VKIVMKMTMVAMCDDCDEDDIDDDAE